MDSPETLFDLLRDFATSSPESVCLQLSDSDEQMTSGQLLDQVEKFAAGLHDAGLRRGDSIAMWLPNSIEWVVVQFAAARLGILAVPLNTRYKPAEVAHLLGVGGCHALVFMPGFHNIDFAAMVEDVLDRVPDDSPLRLLITAGSDLPDGFDSHGRFSVSYDAIAPSDVVLDSIETGQPDDPSTVFGTSGTTSYPKLAAHDQKTIVRHVRNAAAAMHMVEDDRTLCFLPFCGTFGFVGLLATLASGARAVVQPVYTHAGAVEAISARGVTILLATEAICRGLFDEEQAGPQTFRTWNRGIVAGVMVSDLIDRADEEFELKLVNVYGSSELFAVMAVWDPQDPAEVRAIPGGRLVEADMYVRAVDTQTDEVVAQDAYGELQFSGYNLPLGYLANETANAEAFTADGWYRSKDRGRVLESGRAFEYQSRMTDSLRLRGYLVSPVEIEELLVTHESVDEAQVVGVHDGSTGEDLAVAFVTPASEQSIDLEQVRDYCRSNLAGWKVPELIVPVDGFPTTPSANGDKVQKNRLRDMAAEHLASRDT